MATGAWKNRALRGETDPPLKPGIDPEHANPVDPPDPTMRDLTGAPQLPTEWAGGQFMQPAIGTMYVDRTPETHTTGVVSLPGVPEGVAQAVGGAARSVDLGAMDERRYVRPKYQEGGGALHAEITNADNKGDSPATVALQRKGVGGTDDVYARHNRRIARWQNRPVDWHWWASQPRPRLVHNAIGSREKPLVPNRTQYVSPYTAHTIIRPDNWATPIVRRSQAAWGQDFATDEVEGAGSLNFGLGSWGL